MRQSPTTKALTGKSDTMTKLLKYLVFFAAGLIVSALVLVFVLLTVIDPNRYRPVIEALVAEQTGLTLSIAGDMRWTFRPVFGLSLQDVRLSNGITPQELASFSSIALKLDPAGALRGQLNLQELVADNLHVNWIVDASGQSNWLLDTSVRSTPNPTGPTDIPVELNIQQITVNNASIDVRNLEQGYNTSLKNLNLVSRNSNLHGRPFPLELSMRLIDNLSERDLRMNMQATTSLDVNQGTIALENLLFNLSPVLINGRVLVQNFRDSPDWQAELSSNTFNLPYLLENFIALADSNMPGPDAQQVTVRSLRASGDNTGVSVQQLSLAANDTDIELRADLLFANNNRRTLIGYELSSSAINLDAWLPANNSVTTDDSEATPTAADTDIPLPLDFLRNYEIRGNHSIAALNYDGLQFSPLDFTLQLQNAVLELTTQPIGFYDGTLSANGRIDARSNPAAVTLESELQNISATALTTDKPRLGFFTGRFNASSNHSMRGNSVHSLRDSISGASHLQVADSAVDITMIKRVFSAIGVINPRGDFTAQWPDNITFNTVDAYLLFDNGMAANQEVSIRLDNFDMSGTGGVDMANGRFNYQLGFTILGEPAPQTIRVNEDYHNIVWPVRCNAAFSDPAAQYCSPDLQRARELIAQMARNEVERRATDAVNEQIDRLRNRVRNLLQN
jgi:AsmA protein